MHGSSASASSGRLPASPTALAQLVELIERLPAPPELVEIRLHPFDYLRMPWKRAREDASGSPALARLAGIRVMADRSVCIGHVREYDRDGRVIGEHVTATEAEWLARLERERRGLPEPVKYT